MLKVRAEADKWSLHVSKSRWDLSRSCPLELRAPTPVIYSTLHYIKKVREKGRGKNAPNMDSFSSHVVKGSKSESHDCHRMP